MPSSTASSTPRTALPSTARPCANRRKNPASVESLTLTPPSEPLKLSTGATVRDHRNAGRDRSESLSAIDRNDCPHSAESALCHWQGTFDFTLDGAISTCQMQCRQLLDLYGNKRRRNGGAPSYARKLSAKL